MNEIKQSVIRRALLAVVRAMRSKHLAQLFALGLLSLVASVQAAPDPWAWGFNHNGELGNGNDANSNLPTRVSAVNVAAISAFGSHGLALKLKGTVVAWGFNQFGQLGDGTTASRNLPVTVSGLANIQAIAAGTYHSLAVSAAGTVWAWGSNQYGQLGNGSGGEMGAYSSLPVKVSNLAGVVAVAGGETHSLALTSDGVIWAWGDNYHGELGNGSTVSSTVPVLVSGLEDVIAIAAGSQYSLALKSDGTVWSWGYNGAYGQLGNGDSSGSTVPVRVGQLAEVTAIAAGFHHGLALKADGSVWTWGFNGSGQLGDGSNADSPVPVRVSGLTDVLGIEAGGSSFAVKNDGSVWAWGDNGFGQLGDGSNSSSNVPVPVSGLRGVIAVAGGINFGLALANPLVQLTPAALDFGPQILGSSSAARYVDVRNAGSGNLQLSSLTFGGPHAADYQLSSDTCSRKTLAPGSICRVGVKFIPGAAGSRSATLRIVDNAADSPQTVPLQGDGILPIADLAVALSASPNALVTFAYQATVHNHGPDTSPAAYMDLALPDSAQVKEISTTQGSCQPPTPGTAMRCVFGAIPHGTSITVNVSLDLPGINASSTATVSQSVALDPDASNNSATVTSGIP